jgi:membrane-associated phospholipid phosphatase
MLSSEWVSLVYFGATAVLAFTRPLPRGRRTRIVAVAGSTCAAIVLVARTGGARVRSVAPLAVILIGYYLSGSFAVSPSARFERWLLSWDRRLLGDPATRFAGWPRAALAVLEIIYVGCFLLVPAGLASLLAVAAAPALIDRYWTIVIASEFGSFLSLAFVYARPPWALEQRARLPDRAVHRLATVFVERFTIRANTFPSGHAAGSMAVALGVLGAAPARVGTFLLILALAISAAAIVGRYHYAVDVLAGVLLALAIFATLG